MPRSSYTINCDLGEGIPNEELIMPLIDVASVACGGHFGDRSTIQDTLTLVKRFGKKAGAHPSYPDQENFGRKSLQLTPTDLLLSIKAQLRLFEEVAQEKNLEINHIKFHGALYNDAAEDAELATILVDFLKTEFPYVPLFVPPRSELEKAAREKMLPIQLEIFGDRAYLENYKLVSRSQENSLFQQKNEVIAHLEPLFAQQMIRTINGQLIPVEADTICFHGDNSGILEFLPAILDQFWT
ncbi:LamB/YcsF family protein [Algoriphagus litoralis]|uniref:LamB/YcsF family protein n=1 Tax=Algoriphagus litoralis TaxID=2202829 RepID=UPI000DBA06AC|nr:LamB/YcsF family protein [Algoriphagus litoralis]